MTREQILEWCHLAPAVGAVKHEEFADYVVALQQRKKIDDEWTTVETPSPLPELMNCIVFWACSGSSRSMDRQRLASSPSLATRPDCSARSLS